MVCHLTGRWVLRSTLHHLDLWKVSCVTAYNVVLRVHFHRIFQPPLHTMADLLTHVILDDGWMDGVGLLWVCANTMCTDTAERRGAEGSSSKRPSWNVARGTLLNWKILRRNYLNFIKWLNKIALPGSSHWVSHTASQCFHQVVATDFCSRYHAFASWRGRWKYYNHWSRCCKCTIETRSYWGDSEMKTIIWK